MKYDTKLKINKILPWLPMFTLEDMQWRNTTSFKTGWDLGYEVGHAEAMKYATAQLNEVLENRKSKETIKDDQ